MLKRGLHYPYMQWDAGNVDKEYCRLLICIRELTVDKSSVPKAIEIEMLYGETELSKNFFLVSHYLGRDIRPV